MRANPRPGSRHGITRAPTGFHWAYEAMNKFMCVPLLLMALYGII